MPLSLNGLKALNALRNVLLVLIIISHVKSSEKYEAGVAVVDVTSVVTEEMMYGYARKHQDCRGLHTRQYSRAFVFSDQKKVVAVVVVDVAMISQALKQEVVERLQVNLPGVFNHKNLLLTATHSHSLPGGYHTYKLYVIPSGGFNREVIDTMATGITQSVTEAYNGRRPSALSVIEDQLKGVSVNRSPYAYHNNPKEDLDRYEDETDKSFHVLRIKDKEENVTGLISFFGVHPVSINATNQLVSSDSFGLAALRTQQVLSSSQNARVVAAFAQSCSGDSSPYLKGALCQDTNEACSQVHSTCPEAPNNPRLCTGRGPTEDQFTNAELIGTALSDKTIELNARKDGWVKGKGRKDEGMNDGWTKMNGRIDYLHQWINMSNQTVKECGKSIKTCRAALGYSFGAGATDAPGMPPFVQGMFKTIPLVELATVAMFNKSREDAECHRPKPIFLHTGSVTEPLPWQPSIVPLQMIMIGGVVLVAVPAEVTTMAGRKLKEAIQKVLSLNGKNKKVIINSLSNSYSSYISTPHEYMVQRYEGASTIYGKATLDLYVHHYKRMAKALCYNEALPSGTPPADYRGLQAASLSKPKLDLLGKGEYYGKVLRSPQKSYRRGDVVVCSFRAGNPRNVLAMNMSFMRVDMEKGQSTWSTVFGDADWSTKMHWNSACHDKLEGLVGTCTRKSQLSEVKLEWTIPLYQKAGVYRMVHAGMARVGKEKLQEYEGMTMQFSVQI